MGKRPRGKTRAPRERKAPARAEPPERLATPFRGLAARLRAEAAARPAAPPPPPPPPAPPAPPAPSRPPTGPEEPGELFSEAVRGAVPLGDEDRTRVAPARAPRPARPPADVRAEAEALAELCDLVEGRAGFDIADSDEYIEGAANGLDRRIVHRLRKGEYAVQAHLDLHGLTKAEAREAVDTFVTAQRALGHRCVLIIHGRGLGSKDQIPVLKERLRVWLSSGRLSRAVLAFATARPSDGGAGAVYVLLRRIHATRAP